MWKVFEFRQCPTTFGPVATKSIRIFQKIVSAHGEPQKPTTSEVELLESIRIFNNCSVSSVCWRQYLRSQEANLKFLAALKPYLTADARVDILACELVAGETGMKALIDSSQDSRDIQDSDDFQHNHIESLRVKSSPFYWHKTKDKRMKGVNIPYPPNHSSFKNDRCWMI